MSDPTTYDTTTKVTSFALDETVTLKEAHFHVRVEEVKEDRDPSPFVLRPRMAKVTMVAFVPMDQIVLTIL